MTDRRRPPTPLPAPVTPRAFSCRCGRPVFFRNSECLACGTPLGYDPFRRALLPLVPAVPLEDAAARADRLWREATDRPGATRYRRCANLGSAAACNWLVPVPHIARAPAPGPEPGAIPAPLCASCRLTRTVPDLSVPPAAAWWQRIEQDKRRLVSTLIAQGLPVRSKVDEDPRRGLLFDLLRAPPGGPAIVTGHADGVITIDVEEADDSHRERQRAVLGESYRTLLGHLRHETGHYYWQRLVDGTRWLAPFRARFGDERADYAAALARHHAQGAPADWRERHVSAYASSHPWEDWAETWAHYLHLVDTLDTARSFGLDGERVDLQYERYGMDVLRDVAAQTGPSAGPEAKTGTDRETETDTDGRRFLSLVNSWMELTGVLNELSRSMGVADFYPFVLSRDVVRKLHLVHRVIGGAAAGIQDV